MFKRSLHGKIEVLLAKIHSFVLIGIDAIVCEVEVDVSQRGLARTVMVGLGADGGEANRSSAFGGRSSTPDTRFRGIPFSSILRPRM